MKLFSKMAVGVSFMGLAALAGGGVQAQTALYQQTTHPSGPPPAVTNYAPNNPQSAAQIVSTFNQPPANPSQYLPGGQLSLPNGQATPLPPSLAKPLPVGGVSVPREGEMDSQGRVVHYQRAEREQGTGTGALEGEMLPQRVFNNIERR